MKHCACIAVLAAASFGAWAADCPPRREPRIATTIELPINIDKVKRQLRDYKVGNYAQDTAAVAADALGYLRSRAAAVSNAAIVLDIDETALLNWPAIDADDFGFIPNGSCDDPTRGPCGFSAWVARGEAAAIEPTLSVYNGARELGVKVFFVTGRLEETREVTAANLLRAGYEGVDKSALIMRPKDQARIPAQEYKTAARKEIARNFTILANMGDQESDLAGGFAECTFKLPNPFYFIP